MIAHRGLSLEQPYCTQSVDWYQVVGSSAEQKTNAVSERFGSFRDSRKRTVLSQHTESSRSGSGLGILIAKRSSEIRYGFMFARVVRSAVIAAQAVGTAAMLLMMESCHCSNAFTRMAHALVSCLASLLSARTIAMFMHYCCV